MEYIKNKLKKKIKFNRTDLTSPMKMEYPTEGEPKLTPDGEEYLDSRKNLREGLDFYKSNPKMPKSKDMLKVKRKRYIEAIRKMKGK